MKTDVLVLLALDLAFLTAVFIMLARIQSRLDHIERRLKNGGSKATNSRQKKSPTKKD